MISLLDKFEIIRLHKKGYSQRKICKETGFSKDTVGKYINRYKMEIEELYREGADLKEIQEKILSKPKYDSSTRKKRKYTKEIDEFLDDILNEEKEKDKILGNHKQKLTNTQIYKKVAAAGYEISASTIYNNLREKRNKVKESFIRQDYDFADRLEFDFGEVKLVIKDKVKTYYMAVLSSPGSNFRYAYLYKTQKKDVFLDAHVNFFEMIGGVYKEVVYDNMRNVVSKFIGRNEKELNEDLIKMATYYGFDINVTNAFSGHEKGFVEGSVKYIRNEIFSDRYRFDSLTQVREYLSHELVRLNKNSQIDEEKKYLQPYKPKLEIAEVRTVTVNKYSFVKIMNNSYSLPDYLVGKKIIAKVYYDTIRFYSNNHFIYEHKKIDGKNQISVDIKHYLTTLKRKPGAIPNSLALKSIPRLKSIYDIYYSKIPKEFIDLIIKYKDQKMEEIILKLKIHATSTKSINNDEIIASTENQLNKYNELFIGRYH